MGSSFAVLVLIIRLATGAIVVTEIPFHETDGQFAIGNCENAQINMAPGTTLVARGCFVNPGYST